LALSLFLEKSFARFSKLETSFSIAKTNDRKIVVKI